MTAKDKLDELQQMMREEQGLSADGTTAPDYGYSCDYCKEKAHYDAQTISGLWAFMCDQHFAEHTHKRLGWGFGQRLVPITD